MTLHVCFIGASTVEGLGDEAFLGWPGRLRCLEGATDLAFYNLGVRGHSSAAIAQRWRSECAARIPEGSKGAVVLSFGNNDIAEFDDGSTRVPVEETIKTVSEVVDSCSKWKTTLWVGPTPVDELQMPFYSRLLQRNLSYRNERLAWLNATFSSVAARLGVPYVNLFDPLRESSTFMDAIRNRDGLHPNGGGYEVIAGLLTHCGEWRSIVDQPRQ